MNKIIKSIITILCFLIITASLNLFGSGYVHHDLKISIQPGDAFIRVEDTVTLPMSMLKKKTHFLLHGNLEIMEHRGIGEIEQEKGELKKEFFGINTAEFEIKEKMPLAHYSFPAPKIKNGQVEFTLVYQGKIHHPITQVGAEYARGFSETPGIISEKGIYLGGSSFWLPWFNDDLVTFKMEVSLPKDWSAVSQGKRTKNEKNDKRSLCAWDSPDPMSQVYLIGAPFHEYSIKVGETAIIAFLRKPDDSLANRYLETTGQYLKMYEYLIGPYPYSKFALIENFWETGYGMPSFTLLGEKVIRFPFILHSSYPHELLHNWWGNSVFVDYESGNWCEGLTTFMADHLIKEQRGQGAEYRKTTLQGYTDYAAGKEGEFALTQFKARYDSLSSSIGYGKSLMFYNMLRHEVGDKQFLAGIRDFYKSNRNKRATFQDLRQSFEKISGKDFKAFFKQWLSRKGAPELRLKKTSLKSQEGKFLLDFTLEQVQAGEAYSLKVPAAIYLTGQKEAIEKTLEIKDKSKSYTFSFDRAPTRITIDPQFDVFRKLHRDEIHPSLSKAFGAEKILVLLPFHANPEIKKAYQELAEKWTKESRGKMEIKTDRDLEKLPSDRAIWLFGKENLHLTVISGGITPYRAGLDKNFTVSGKTRALDKNSIVISVKNPGNPDQVVVLLSADRATALPGLGRKLPHYGKYSYLGFEGDEPANTLKGEWETFNSPLNATLKEDNSPHTLPARKPLAQLAPAFSALNMMSHIKRLASEELEGRGIGSKGIAKAAAYIANEFKKAGLKPGAPGHSYMQKWQAKVQVADHQQVSELVNVIGILPGSNPALKDEPVILSAHYDHLGLGWPDVRKGNKGKIHYGADDNASGVAVMLELAYRLGKGFKPERPIIFVAFTGEESGRLGSIYYLDNLAKDQKTFAAVNLDSVGRLKEKQKLMVIGGSSAREWRFIFMGINYTTGIESELITQELDASDQVSFIQKNIPAIQLFSGPHKDYHQPSDTIEKIEAQGLVKVAAVARETIVYLSGRKEPLTIKGQKPAAGKPAASRGARRVKTGLMPDFAFKGEGVKIGMITPGSPAQKGGLKPGDIIISIGGTPVKNLKEYSNKLKEHQPGDKVKIQYTREGKKHTTEITLAER